MFPYIDRLDNNGGKNYQISVPGLYKIENGVVKYISSTTTDKKNIIALFYKSASADAKIVYNINNNGWIEFPGIALTDSKFKSGFKYFVTYAKSMDFVFYNNGVRDGGTTGNSYTISSPGIYTIEEGKITPSAKTIDDTGDLIPTKTKENYGMSIYSFKDGFNRVELPYQKLAYNKFAVKIDSKDSAYGFYADFSPYIGNVITVYDSTGNIVSKSKIIDTKDGKNWRSATFYLSTGLNNLTITEEKADSVYSVNKQSSSLKRSAAGASSTVKRGYVQDINNTYFNSNTDLGNGVWFYSMKGIKRLEHFNIQEVEYGSYMDYIKKYDIFVEFSIDDPVKVPPKSVELIVNRDNYCSIVGDSYYPAYIYKANNKTIYRFAIIGAGKADLWHEIYLSSLRMNVSVKSNPSDPQGKIFKCSDGSDLTFIYDAITFTESYNYLYLNSTTSLGTKNDGGIGELLDSFYKVSKDFGETAPQYIKDAAVRKYDFTKLNSFMKESAAYYRDFQYMGIDSNAGFGGSHVFVITIWPDDSDYNTPILYKRINIPYNSFSLIQTLKYSNLPKTVKVSFGGKKDLAGISIPVDVTMTDNTGLTYMDTERWFMVTDEDGNSKEYHQNFFIPPKSGAYTLVGIGSYNGQRILSSEQKINVADKLTINLSSINTATNSLKVSFLKGVTPREVKAGKPTEIYLTKKMVSDAGGFYGVKIESPATSNMVISGNISFNNQKVCNLAGAKVNAGMVLWAKDLSNFKFNLDVYSREKQDINSVPTYTFYKNISASIPVTLSAKNSLNEELYIDLASVNYNCFNNSWQKVNIDYNNVNSLLSARCDKYYLSYLYSNGYIPYSEGYGSTSTSKKYSSNTVSIKLHDIATVELSEEKLPVIQNPFKLFDYTKGKQTSFSAIIRDSKGEVITVPDIESMKCFDISDNFGNTWSSFNGDLSLMAPKYYAVRCRIVNNGKLLATSNSVFIRAVRKPVKLSLTEANGKQIIESDGTIIFPEESKLVMEVIADDGKSYSIDNYFISHDFPTSINWSSVIKNGVNTYSLATNTTFDNETVGNVSIFFYEFNVSPFTFKVKVQERIPKTINFTANKNTILADNSEYIVFTSTIKDQFGDDYKGSVEYNVTNKTNRASFELASDSFKTFEPGDYTVTARAGGVEFEDKKINVTVNKREPQIKSITASKKSILANGNDFTRLDAVVVDQNGQEMPAMVKFYDDGKEINGNEFNTKISGSHPITASVVDGSSNVIKRDTNNKLDINAEANVKDMLFYKIAKVYEVYTGSACNPRNKSIVENYHLLKQITDITSKYQDYQQNRKINSWGSIFRRRENAKEINNFIINASWGSDTEKNQKLFFELNYEPELRNYLVAYIHTDSNNDCKITYSDTSKYTAEKIRSIYTLSIIDKYIKESKFDYKYKLRYQISEEYKPFVAHSLAYEANVEYADKEFTVWYNNNEDSKFKAAYDEYDQVLPKKFADILNDYGKRDRIEKFCSSFDINGKEWEGSLLSSYGKINKAYAELKKLNNDYYAETLKNTEIIYEVLTKEGYYTEGSGFSATWMNRKDTVDVNLDENTKNKTLSELYTAYMNTTSNLTITADGTEVTLGIPYVEGAKTYEIQRKGNTDSSFEVIGTPGIPLFFDYGRADNSYEYLCIAKDINGAECGRSTGTSEVLKVTKAPDTLEITEFRKMFSAFTEEQKEIFLYLLTYDSEAMSYYRTTFPEIFTQLDARIKRNTNGTSAFKIDPEKLKRLQKTEEELIKATNKGEFTRVNDKVIRFNPRGASGVAGGVLATRIGLMTVLKFAVVVSLAEIEIPVFAVMYYIENWDSISDGAVTCFNWVKDDLITENYIGLSVNLDKFINKAKIFASRRCVYGNNYYTLYIETEDGFERYIYVRNSTGEEFFSLNEAVNANGLKTEIYFENDLYVERRILDKDRKSVDVEYIDKKSGKIYKKDEEDENLLQLYMDNGLGKWVERNKMSYDKEVVQGIELAMLTGQKFIGAQDEKEPGIDGTMGGRPISLKRYTEDNISKIRSYAKEAEKKAKDAGYRDIDVYISAKHVKKLENTSGLVIYANSGELSLITTRETVRRIYIYTYDGWFIIENGVAKKM